MESSVLTCLVAAALLLSVATKFWLATRQMRYVALHRGSLPVAFAANITLATHQKAADYTLVKGRFGLLGTAFSAFTFIGWTWLGGLEALNDALRLAVEPRLGVMAYQLALIASFTVLGGLLELPFDLYGTFQIEHRFGFNRMTWGLYLGDMLKNAAVGALVGLPIAALILGIMGRAGSAWWLWAWLAWMGINLMAMVIYPLIISPLYNKFQPLEDAELKRRLRQLMARCGFTVKGFFVMDGSKRSAHSNAYFTGLGSAKRVVFFDTLLGSLDGDEMEAVLAHELGHFKHKHLPKRIAAMFVLSLAGFVLLGWQSAHPWFYIALGVQPLLKGGNEALALLLFLMVVPLFSFFVSPLFAQLSRRHEFEADAYACIQTDAQHLASALMKLYQDNASTLTPDPLYVRFYYSHPPASERIAALLGATVTPVHR